MKLLKNHHILAALLSLTTCDSKTSKGSNNVELTPPAWVKNIAIAYHGQYIRKEELFHAHATGCSIYFNDAENIRKYLELPLMRHNRTVTSFFHTVNHCSQSDRKLVDDIKPASFMFSSSKLPRIVDSYISVLDLVSKWRTPVDIVILTRFDVSFRWPITRLWIDWSKINIAFKDGPTYFSKEHKVSDLFHIFPRNLLREVRAALDASARGSGHYIYNYLVKELGQSKIHFIEPRGRSSNVGINDSNPTFLYIDRSCLGFEKLCASQINGSTIFNGSYLPSEGTLEPAASASLSLTLPTLL